ncbi:MAG: metallophosphoesterase [Caldimicrobium sp.]|nr:metallophosphoesterase [Caldimicrobium sp.]
MSRRFIPIFIFFYISPLFWSYFDNHVSDPFSYYFIFSSLLWMGFMVYAGFFTLSTDLYSGISFILDKFLSIKLPRPKLKMKRFLVLILSLIFSLYSYIETLSLRVERYEIGTNKPLFNKERIKILHISDVHFGRIMREDRLKLIQEVWLKEKPDIVFSTGDLVDGNIKKIEHIAQALRELSTPLGKYAVLGNHEFYRGVKNSVEFTEKAGFTVLRGRWVDLGSIAIAGVDDEACRYFKACVEPIEEEKALKDIPQDRFIILLKHRPKVKKEVVGRFDLMLSGHLHGGLYFPIGELILKRFYIAHQGLTKIDGSFVHVSKGVGTGGPPMRFFTPPDVAIIEIKKEE